MTIFSKMTFLILSTVLIFSACTKDDPVLEDENELINQVKIEITDTVRQKTYTWMEGNIDTIFLFANQDHSVKIAFFGLSSNQVEIDITEEIKEENDAHQIFYTSNPSDLLSISYEDQDENGIPVGLNMSMTSGSSKEGTLRIQLKHYAAGKDGKITSGSSDIDLEFPVVIQ